MRLCNTQLRLNGGCVVKCTSLFLERTVLTTATRDWQGRTRVRRHYLTPPGECPGTVGWTWWMGWELLGPCILFVTVHVLFIYFLK